MAFKGQNFNGSNGKDKSSRLSRATTEHSGFEVFSFPSILYSVFTIVLAVKQHLKKALSKHRNLILHAGLQRFRCCASQYYVLHFIQWPPVGWLQLRLLSGLKQCGLKSVKFVLFWEASWNQINQFHEKIFDQNPFFAISKMAKNQFLNREEV